MSKKALNVLIRQKIVNHVLGNNMAGKGPTSSIATIDFVTQNMTDPRVTRDRVSGNISAVCCRYKQLSYADGYLS